MDIDLATLPDDVETLQNLVRSLAAERTSLSEAQAEIERLHLIIKKLQPSQFGRRAERLDDDQLHLGFEDLNADLARAEAILPSARNKTPKSVVPALASLACWRTGWKTNPPSAGFRACSNFFSNSAAIAVGITTDVRSPNRLPQSSWAIFKLT